MRGICCAAAGLELEDMNMDVNPRQDFMGFSWGKWSERNPIPNEYSSWGVFYKLRDQVLADVKSLCEAKANEIDQLDPSTCEGQIARFWKAAMDEEGVESAGISSLLPLFEKIDAATDLSSYIEAIAYLHTQGIPVLFEASVLSDFKDSETERLFFGQGGLGLPDRDYYTEEEKASKVAAYEKHIATMWALLNFENDADAVAATIVAIERRIAQVSRTRTAMRDLPSLYNKQTSEEMTNATFPWVAAFSGYGIELPEFTISMTPEIFDFLATDINESTFEDYKLYAKWHTLKSLASYLPAAFVNEEFNLSKELSGAKELAARWKRVVNTLNDTCGELMGAVYCASYFPPESKAAMVELVSYLKEALAESLSELTWMTSETKEKSMVKLNSFMTKIGYPDKWTDFSSLELNGSYVDVVLAMRRFMFGENIASRVNQKVQKHRWEMPPQMVNAYYNPMLNEIVFPAAILQNPSFSLERDMAMNFGAIGAVIGHEMTHGFDDQGRLFDAQGNMSEWWTPEDSEAFNERAKVVVEQYNKYTVLGRSVNGQMTLGENIADIGGVKIAFKALKLYLERNGRPELIDGYTPEQRFFLSWGQFWASSARDEQALKLLSVDVHSPGFLRSFAPLKNLPEFYQAFGIEEGDAMYLPQEERAAIW
ncbi:peptidase M13 [Thraustotheca clavata]|uniref:Peptidase M13 n=1 Tax=Thraustotheca clavata TaxID=74557 RepID=A0A1V9Z3E2_9STRA|nr:peptidase M13 [Thraustotheca clavata]